MVNLYNENRNLNLMEYPSITAAAHPNIAFIKYWGNRDDHFRIPLNGSISMNLDGLATETTVQFDPLLAGDKVIINDLPASMAAYRRVSEHLDLVRQMAGFSDRAHVTSCNNFPMGSGIASSASAFAALTLAAPRAAGLSLDPIALSRLARRGSGSACRSIPSGIVEWHAGTRDDDSFAEQLVPADYWDLVDCLVVISEGHKTTGSSEGHQLASTSPLQGLRVDDADRRLEICRKSILNRDFESFADVVEQDSNLMHSVMCTSNPKLVYWTESTIGVINAVIRLRKQGIEAAYTVDAGPNVHVITRKSASVTVKRNLEGLPGVLRIVLSPIGDGASVIEQSTRLS
jgi:diphosphomevalonate decarboxylase